MATDPNTERALPVADRQTKPMQVWKQREQRAEQNAAKDLKRHALTIVRDDGVSRHIRYRQPNTGCYWYDLITWPGGLCIDGDMGTFVFHRVRDMFQFFRHDRINPGYWSEKLAQPLGRKGVKEYSEDSFVESVTQWRDQYLEDLDPEKRAEFQQQVADDILWYADQGHHEAVRHWCDFTFDDIYASDCYEYDVTEYEYGFLWSLWAIVHGIKLYDAHNDSQPKWRQLLRRRRWQKAMRGAAE